jgi:hypothetical protein
MRECWEGCGSGNLLHVRVELAPAQHMPSTHTQTVQTHQPEISPVRLEIAMTHTRAAKTRPASALHARGPRRRARSSQRRAACQRQGGISHGLGLLHDGCVGHHRVILDARADGVPGRLEERHRVAGVLRPQKPSEHVDAFWKWFISV